MTKPADKIGSDGNKRLVVRLCFVSVAVLLTVFAFTRGTSKQLKVEERIAELENLAELNGLSVPLFIALCVTESYAATPRGDQRLAELLKLASLDDHDKLGPDDFASLLDDPVQRKFVVDLLARNRKRWLRLTAKR